MPPMLRDIVIAAVATEPDIEVIIARGDADQWPRVSMASDVVITGTREPDDLALAPRALGSQAGRTVLAIAINGRTATMWQLKPYRVALGDVSPQSLVAAIRTGVETR